MLKITFMGAGSTVFAKNVLGDTLLTEALRECEIALYDIDKTRLEESEIVIRAINKKYNADRAVIKTYLGVENRKEALRGANFVINAIQVGLYDPCTIIDFEIPKKYGLRQTIADTLGIGGIFRALRNIPLMLEICRDIEKYCPNAVFLNYTNPMSMLCGAMQRNTNVEVTGLCHSVQHTAAMLAEWLGVPPDEINYKCIGVNHQAFYTEFKHDGEDLYPRLRELLKNDEVYRREMVRNEMFLKLGYYPTESSGHNSEYNAWFRKRPDLIEKYCTHSTNWNPGEYAFSLNLRLEREKDPLKQYDDYLNKDINTKKSPEYAAEIFNARFGDGKPFVFNGNVINSGAITNLPDDACVEVPVIADKNGMKTTVCGMLPSHLAILVNTTARIETLVSDAAIRKSKEDIYHAVYMDPLCSAVCSLDEIKNMCDELFEVNKDFLGDYK